ncbi:MAG: glycosyltransferase family 4 protein [Acidimicrobiia bacterium]|nr:glycosyltransferase family 4 protein [Acidimicrobiia bacterium]
MVVYSYYPLGETRVQREAEALVEAGFEVDLICPRQTGERRRESYHGVTVHRLPMEIRKASLLDQLLGYLLFLAVSGAQLTRLHLRRRYHSIQVHNLPDFLVFCALVPKLMGVPVVLDLHDLMPEFFAGRFENGPRWLRHLIRLQERVACGFGDLVITVSDHWRDVLVERGVAPDKILVVMNVADERIFRIPDPPPTRGEGFSLIYHGTVTHRYGLDLAVSAVALLRQEIPGLRLTILGKGDQMEELCSLTKQLGVGDMVELRNELVPAECLPDIIARADLGIVPYRSDVFTDGLLPTKLMEYAVMGLPCVAAATTAIDAYFRDTMIAFFTPGDARSLADTILELHRDPDRRWRLAEQARVFTSRHNWQEIGAEYVAEVTKLARKAVQPV